LSSASVLILTDEPDFAAIVSGAWQAQRKAASIAVLNSKLWRNYEVGEHDLVIVGAVSRGKPQDILKTLDPVTAVVVCIETESRDAEELRSRFPHVVLLQKRDDWPHTLLLVAGEMLRRVEAQKTTKQLEREAAKSQNLATLGRYMTDMKHSMNNALTSLLGNAELLMLDPGQLSSESLIQIRTVHSMALRINEIMNRFSALSNEMREAEKASQAETESSETSVSRNR
jgi:signal transduction histidine kinase